jgi:hypothetical protein
MQGRHRLDHCVGARLAAASIAERTVMSPAAAPIGIGMPRTARKPHVPNAVAASSPGAGDDSDRVARR